MIRADSQTVRDRQSINHFVKTLNSAGDGPLHVRQREDVHLYPFMQSAQPVQVATRLSVYPSLLHVGLFRLIRPRGRARYRFDAVSLPEAKPDFGVSTDLCCRR
ncbi:unnamed protein product [Protopolystoma xenopodis]|uniref:Uncharacterized protein n=1 Tax=Protopolystoma xenopodis TaxID=117903 RepID=A0A448XNG9_9PLAT|nr:unnamed protein product [Protopolystoma xenopodis]